MTCPEYTFKETYTGKVTFYNVPENTAMCKWSHCTKISIDLIIMLLDSRIRKYSKLDTCNFLVQVLFKLWKPIRLNKICFDEDLAMRSKSARKLAKDLNNLYFIEDRTREYIEAKLETSSIPSF